MTRTTSRALALLVALSVLMAACGGDSADTDAAADGPGAGQSEGGGTGADDGGGGRADEVLRVAWPSQPGTLDPHKAQSGDKGPLYQIYDSLIMADPQTLEPVPGLAESWTYETETRLVLTLREGVMFHDGTPFDAEAVRYNIERGQSLEGSTVASDLATIESVEVVDPRTVALVLSQPDVALVGKFDDRPGLMVSPTASERLGAEYGVSEAVGTGPFVLDQWRQGDRAEFSAHDGYWRTGMPGFASLSLRFMEDPNVAVSALLAGELDAVFGLSSDLVSRLEGNDDVEVVTAPSIEHEQIYFNMSRPPLDDVRVRQAINLAIDREAMSQATTGGLGEVAWMPFPSTHWAHVADATPTFEHDPDRAKELLAEAGHADGFKLTAVTWPDPARVRRAEMWQADLAAIGIEVELKPMPLNEGVARYFEDEQFDLGSWGWGGRPDPNQTLELLYRAGSFYYKGEAQPAVDELLATAASASTEEERVEVYGELIPLVTSELALNVPLHFNPNIVALRDGLEGFEPHLVRSTARLGELRAS